MSPAPLSEELLQAYVDAVLDPERRREVELYLAEHPEQAQRIAAYQRQRELVRGAYDAVMHEPLPDRLLNARSRSGMHPALRVAAVLAWITLGVALGWGLRGELPRADGAESELVQRARVAHRIYTAENRRAVEVAASQEQDMIRWLSKRMNAAVRVPNLTEFGFEALGGRLLPGIQGAACQIMYQDAAGKRITIYLARDDGKAKAMRFRDDEAVHVIFWSDGTLAFAVSGEIDGERLARIAEAVARESRPRG